MVGATEKLDMDDPRSSLIDSSSSSIPSGEAASDSDQPPLKRTGTQWTAVAHIITGVIGAGVLSLAWSVAQLGWVLGPLCILTFAPIVLVSSFLVCDCYKYPDPINNGAIRNRSYMEAVSLYLGEKHQWVSGLFLYEGFYGNGIAYTITAAASVRAILKSNCYHREGHDASCEYGDSLYMLLFGLLQIVMSQIPDFHNMEWLSIISAAMSFSYSFIGAGLGLAKVIENGTIKGSITGVASSSSSVASKVWLSFEALGDITFSYPKPVIVLEIQDTLRSNPPENQTMKRASSISISIAAFFYLCCGCFGYAAFGDQTPGNLLTGFGFYEPYWLVDFANACIFIHLVGGYQIYSQPVFATVERWLMKKYPNSRFVSSSHKLGTSPMLSLNLLRLCFRTTYVISTTAIAIMFPYFNSVLGVLGGLNFWPIAFYFPVEMYFVQKKTRAWSREWIVLRGFSFFCLLISAAAFIGSFEKIIIAKFGPR